MLFKKAVRGESKLRLAIAGPSGSGKTYTALAIATNLTSKPVALVDTENGSASKYAGDPFDFDVAEMHEPFHPEKFITAIQEAAKADYGVIILDSLSHAWMGPGGLLDIVDMAAKKMRNPNTFAAWKEGTPIQNDLINAIVNSPIHIIATMRSKTDYVLKAGDNGKQTPEKVGLAAIQRDGMEYEFDVYLQMNLSNEAIVEKSRCSALTGAVIRKPGKQVADTLSKWLSGNPQAQPPQRQPVANAAPVAPHRDGVQPEPPPVEEDFYSDPALAAQTEPAPIGTADVVDPDNPFYDETIGVKADKAAEQAQLAEKAQYWRQLDKDSESICSDSQYQFLVSTVENIAGKHTHTNVFRAMFKRSIHKDERPGKKAVSWLLDVLPEKVAQRDEENKTVKVDGKTIYIDNPKYDKLAAKAVKVLYETTKQAVAK